MSAVPATIQGRRRDDCVRGDMPSDLQIGDYWKIIHADGRPVSPEEHSGRAHASNLTGTCWYIAVPNPSSRTGRGYLLGNLCAHTVREHADGTISVLPGDGSSNSILVSNTHGSWHGFVRAGVLKTA
jgi:hypothetical protein